MHFSTIYLNLLVCSNQTNLYVRQTDRQTNRQTDNLTVKQTGGGGGVGVVKVEVVVVVEGGLVTGGALVPDCRRAGKPEYRAGASGGSSTVPHCSVALFCSTVDLLLSNCSGEWVRRSRSEIIARCQARTAPYPMISPSTWHLAPGRASSGDW